MKKKKIIKIFLAIILLVIGILIFIYPRVTDYLYKKNVNKLEYKFINDVNKSNSDDNSKLKELYNLLVEENKKIYDDKQNKFLIKKIYENQEINLIDYGLTDNVFGFLEIPSIDVTLPLYLGASKEHMSLGATHLTGTSYPVGGISTNSVIAAHRGYYRTQMFRHIDDIKIGDKLYIKNFMTTLEYSAVKTSVIRPDELNKLLIEDNRDLVTIISCHPYPRNYQRYVVYFERINN